MFSGFNKSSLPKLIRHLKSFPQSDLELNMLLAEVSVKKMAELLVS